MPDDQPVDSHSAAWRRWVAAQPILDAALDAPPHDRSRLVAAACSDDLELLSAVNELLAIAVRDVRFLESEAAVAYPHLMSAALRAAPSGADSTLEELRAALDTRYEIDREIGRGGMATVYLARDVRHDRRVALKVMLPHLAAEIGTARFLAEIATAAKLQHPHILPLHDSGRVNGTVFYVMPYIEGESLRDRLLREKHLPISDAVDIAVSVAGALDYAHRHGVVHRDIKPENILLNDGQPLVADFGIALGTSVRRSGEGARLTEEGTSLGTPAYMSPEQATGDPRIDGRADIFALACVLYEMLTGQPAYAGVTPAEIVAKVLTTPPVPPRVLRATIPPHVEDAIFIGLQKLPADRFSTAADFARALARPATHRPARPWAALPSPRDGSVRRMVGGSMAILAALGAWGWLRPRTLKPPAPLTRFSFPLDAPPRIPDVAVAADGAAFVYVVGNTRATGRLMLRRLDREASAPIPGTEGASQPFFSPDGRSIGFLQDGRLRRVSLSDGDLTTLLDVSAMEGSKALNQAMYGATWGPGDRIVFATPRGLYEVSATGGTPRHIAAPDSSAQQWYFLQPAFSGDGRSVLLEVVSRDYVSHVALVSLDNGTVTPLGVRGRGPKFVAPATLVYTNADGRLFSVPLDLRARRVIGGESQVLEGVALGESPPRAYADVAPSGAIVYVSRQAADERELQLVDRRGVARSLSPERMAWRHPRFSPDGRRIAVGVDAAGASGDIWILHLATRHWSRLTFDSLSIHPGWSRDGEYIVFPHPRLQDGRSALLRMRAAGNAKAETLLVWPRQIWESELLPDGKSLLFREDNAQTIRDIYVARLDSPSLTRVLLGTALDERSIAVGPSGEWLAYVSNDNGRDDVYVRRLVGDAPRLDVSMSGGNEPRWSRDGRELFFKRGDTLFATAMDFARVPAVGVPKALFVGQYQSSPHQALYDPSPSGREFVMVKQRGDESALTLHVLLHWFEHHGTTDAQRAERGRTP